MLRKPLHQAIVCIIFIISILVSHFSAAAEAPDLKLIEDYVQMSLQETKVPGAALAIVKGEKVLYQKGFGLDLKGQRITPDTPFMIGSLSKSFTALALMQQVEKGNLDLDQTVVHYLPWFRVADKTFSKRMTVRQVLTHTSGIGWIPGLTSIDSRDNSPTALKTSIQALATVKLFASPGQRFQYSNANYRIAGAILEAVTRKPYEQAIQDDIYAPLQMRNSFTNKVDAQKQGLAKGYRYWFGQPIPDENLPYSRSNTPSFLLISSAANMAHYLMAHLNNGQYQGQQILSEKGVTTLHQGTARTPWGDTYGLGWFDERWQGVRVLNHYGSYAGYHANMAIAPEQGLGLILLTNAESYVCKEHRWMIAKNAFRLLLGQTVENSSLLTPSCIGFWGMITIPFILVGRIIFALRNMMYTLKYRQLILPSSWQSWVRLLLLPFLFYGCVAVGLIFAIPSLFDATLPSILLTTPDAGWLLVISGAIALTWAIVRPLLVLWILVKKFRRSI
jgi:CubicO group peptidase (beta-lactamase class C family)